MRKKWTVCPSLEWKWLEDSCSSWDLGGPRNGGLPPLVTVGLSQRLPLSWAQTWQVDTSAWEQWSNQWHAGQVKVRGRDGQHQPGGEGVGEEDSELPEERGPRWEDQQAQAPGLIDGSYMKSPPPIIFIILCDCLLAKYWAHYLFAHLKRS